MSCSLAGAWSLHLIRATGACSISLFSIQVTAVMVEKKAVYVEAQEEAALLVQ
jgi:hypothetical protein